MSSQFPGETRAPSTRQLIRTYLACLATIGVMAVAMAAYVISESQDMVGLGERINLTGRQRMLTERLRADALAHQIVATVPTNTDAFDWSEWETGWRRLVNGNESQRLRRASEAERLDLNHLTPLIDSARVALHRLAVRGSAVRDHSEDARAIAVASALVRAIDRLTQRLAERQQADVRVLRAFEVVFTLAFLSVLMFMGKYALVPSTRALSALVREQTAARLSLEQQAELLASNAEELESQNAALADQRARLLESQEELLAQHESLVDERAILEERTATLSRFALTLESTPDLVIMVGIDGRLLYSNPAADRFLPDVGRHRGVSLFRYLARESARTLRADVLPSVMQSGLWRGELDVRARAGDGSPMHVTVIAQRDRFDCPEVFVVIGHDLREERTLRDSLSEREALHRAVIDALAEGVVVQDRSGHIVAWNESATRILGISGDQLSGRTARDTQWNALTIDGAPILPEDHPSTRARVHGERIDGQLMRVVVGDGPARELSVNARPMFANDFDDRPGAVATFTDVTAQRAMHREMETLSVVVRQSDYAVLMADARGRVTWVNAAFEQLTGYTSADVIGAEPGELLHGVHTSAESAAELRLAVHNARRFQGELLQYRKDSTPFWVELMLTPLHDASGALTGFVGLSRDVTARRVADRERQTLAAALAVAADGVAILDVGGTLEFVNHAFARQVGSRPGALINQQWLTLYEEDQADQLTLAMRTHLKSLGFWQGEVRGRRVNGDAFPQDLTLTLLPQGGVVAVVRDISERRAAEDRLTFLSTRDELTGLLNRRGFIKAATERLRETQESGRSCALLYGDLDSFKLINDRFGHPTGDVALQEIGKLLTNTFRDTDLIARLGGDEFTVLAVDVGRDEIDRVLKRLDAQVIAHNTARASDPDQAWTLGVSLGVAFAEPGEPMDIDSLLRNADAAQYVRKSQRKAGRKAA